MTEPWTEALVERVKQIAAICLDGGRKRSDGVVTDNGLIGFAAWAEYELRAALDASGLREAQQERDALREALDAAYIVLHGFSNLFVAHRELISYEALVRSEVIDLLPRIRKLLDLVAEADEIDRLTQERDALQQQVDYFKAEYQDEDSLTILRQERDAALARGRD